MALFQKMLINNELFQNRNLIGGLMSPPYGLSRGFVGEGLDPPKISTLCQKVHYG